MTATVTALVLTAALMHALWNALVKSSSDRLLELTALNAAAGVTALALVPFFGLPGRSSIPYAAASMLFHSGYYLLLLRSYGAGGLSLVYPVARGSAPLFVAASSYALLGEGLGTMQMVSVLVVAFGIVSLAFSAGFRRIGGHAILYSLGTGVTIAGYTLVDGAGVRAARTPLSYITFIFVLNALPLLVALPVLRGGVGASELRAFWRSGLLGGMLSFGAYALALWAMTRGAIALVAALRETSVVIAAAIGAVFLGEPFGRNRIIAAIVVTAGVISLRLAS
jgi:drug/metabolite transporter (DMT)-like permease